MYKRLIITVLFFLLLLPLFPLSNLLQNGDFELQTQGFIDMWYTEAYDKQEDAARFFLYEQDKFSGKSCLGIANLKLNDAKVIQWVQVKPDTYYKITGQVKAMDVKGGAIGANISVIGTTSLLDNFSDTQGTWKSVEVYGVTGTSQTSLGIMARLGYYGSMVTGYAFFDNIALEEVALPPVPQVLDFTTDKLVDVTTKINSGNLAENKTPVTINWAPLIVAVSILLFLVLVLAGIFFFKKDLFRKIFDRMRFRAPLKITGLERRIAQRRRYKLPVCIKKKQRSGKIIESHFICRNISRTGFFINTEEAGLFKLGENLEVQIPLHNEGAIASRARVIRSEIIYNKNKTEKTNGYGLMFVDMEFKMYEQLSAYLSIN